MMKVSITTLIALSVALTGLLSSRSAHENIDPRVLSDAASAQVFGALSAIGTPVNTGVPFKKCGMLPECASHLCEDNVANCAGINVVAHGGVPTDGCAINDFWSMCGAVDLWILGVQEQPCSTGGAACELVGDGMGGFLCREAAIIGDGNVSLSNVAPDSCASVNVLDLLLQIIGSEK